MRYSYTTILPVRSTSCWDDTIVRSWISVCVASFRGIVLRSYKPPTNLCIGVWGALEQSFERPHIGKCRFLRMRCVTLQYIGQRSLLSFVAEAICLFGGKLLTTTPLQILILFFLLLFRIFASLHLAGRCICFGSWAIFITGIVVQIILIITAVGRSEEVKETTYIECIKAKIRAAAVYTK